MDMFFRVAEIYQPLIVFSDLACILILSSVGSSNPWGVTVGQYKHQALNGLLTSQLWGAIQGLKLF